MKLQRWNTSIYTYFTQMRRVAWNYKLWKNRRPNSKRRAYYGDILRLISFLTMQFLAWEPKIYPLRLDDMSAKGGQASWSHFVYFHNDNHRGSGFSTRCEVYCCNDFYLFKQLHSFSRKKLVLFYKARFHHASEVIIYLQYLTELLIQSFKI